jgi:hypothetical protein
MQGGGGHEKVSKGQQWQQEQQQQERTAPRTGPAKSGGSLQALLERDQQLNPQEDPTVQHNPHLAPQLASPGQSEYRRPGTNFKPLKTAEMKPGRTVEDYPLPEKYADYSRGGPSYPPADSYQSTYYPSGGSSQSQASNYPQPGGSFQSTYPAMKLSSAGPNYQQQHQQHGTPRQFPLQQNYPGSSSSQYPSSDYGMGGIPACDF